MTPTTPNRSNVLNALEAANRPLQRYDLLVAVFWEIGYNRDTYRTIHDLPNECLQWLRFIDRMHTDGELVLLPSTKWRQILGTAFDTATIHKQRGYFWFATHNQYALWSSADRTRSERILEITARLKTANLPRSNSTAPTGPATAASSTPTTPKPYTPPSRSSNQTAHASLKSCAITHPTTSSPPTPSPPRRQQPTSS